MDCPVNGASPGGRDERARRVERICLAWDDVPDMVPASTAAFMNDTFTLAGTASDWYGALTDHFRSKAAAGGSLLRLTTHGDVVTSPESTLVKRRLGPEDGVIHVLAEGGTRGVILTPQDDPADECQLQLNVLSSAADWATAHELMRMAIDLGMAVRDASGAALTIADVTEACARDRQEQAWSDQQAAVAAQLDQAGETAAADVHTHTAVLPLMGRQLTITREELALPPRELEALLADRARRFAVAYEASLMSFPGADGTPVYLSNFPHFATLIPKAAQALTLHGETGQIVDSFVPLSIFLGLLGNRIEDAGEFHFVPDVDFAGEPGLVVALQEHQGKLDAPAGGRMVSPNVRQMIFTRRTTGDESDSVELTHGDRVFLQSVPAMILLLVGGADGSLNQRKIDAFIRALARMTRQLGSQADDETFVDEVFSGAAGNLRETLGALTRAISSPGFYADNLGKLRVLVDRKLPEQEAVRLKKAIVELAKMTAVSSGRMFGAKVSPEEKAAVNLVRQALGVH